MTTAAEYRIEHVAEAPKGFRVRTFAPGPRSDHLVRMAFPPGRRKRGAGQLVEILHPPGENPCRFSPESHRIAWIDEIVRRLEEDYRGWRRAGMSEGESLKKTLASSTAGPAAIAELRRRIGARANPEEEPTLFDAIRHGDRVTFVDRFGKQRTGKAVMRGPHGWVLNMGGPHGTPQVVNEDMVTRVRSTNPGKAPRPKKGESAPDYHARRVREILAKMPKPIRDVFDRNPATYKFVFRNPDDGDLPEAERLFESFHGREPREILEMQESSEMRGDYTALGDLVELTMIAPNGDHVLIKFKNDGVRVASSPNGEQLYLLGGNQDISGHLRMFGADDSKDLIDLGEAKQIVYDAAKWQTDFTPQEWKHDFGEESGVRPRGFYDQLKQRIFFAGGNYKVKRPGIVD